MIHDNRRHHQRTEADHAATLLYHGTTLTNCRIRNFSRGGLYLENGSCDFHTLVTTTVPKPGGPSIKHALIEIPNEKSETAPFTVAVRLTYVSETGVGVAYLQENPKLFHYFLSFNLNLPDAEDALNAVTSEPNHPPGQNEKVLRQIVEASCRFLDNTMPALFVDCEEKLPIEAETAPTDTLKTDIYYAQSALKAQETAVIESQSIQLDSRFDQLREPVNSTPYAASSKELDLVDKDDFEEWVVIIGIGRSVESEIPALLQMLEVGLTCLVKRTISSDSNPLSPAHLLWALGNSLESLSIELPVRRIIYSVFKTSVLTRLDELYAEISEIFNRNNIDTNVVSFNARVAKTQQDSANIRPAWNQKNKTMLGTLSSIVSSESEINRNDKSSNPDRRSASSSEILRSLDSLNRFNGRPILELIEKSLARKRGRFGAAELNSESRETISATEQLLSALTEESSLSAGLKHLVRGLEVPLIKEAIKNPAMLDDGSHPARKLLDSIDKLMPYSSGSDTEEPLLRIIEQMSSSSSQQSQDQLIEATHRIEALLSRKRAAFDNNLAVVLESSKQTEQLEKARRAITVQLEERLQNRSVSIAVDRLLQLGWPGLLIQSSVLEDNPEKRTKAYLGALDFLLKLFDQAYEPTPLVSNKLNILITILRRGFSDYPVHSAKAQSLIEEIEFSLTEVGEKWREFIQKRVVIDQSYIRECVDRQAPLANDEEPVPIPDTEWGNLVRTIENGDWIVQKREHGQVRLINLAWQNCNSTHFVFVDGNGRKALDTDAATLADLFKSGEFSRLESRELPLVERAVERMLKNTFSRISNESRIDELTGLLNRKAFSKKIEEQLSRSITDGSHHALILLDIDQFSMVNDICGYEGGDQLLKSVTSIITTYQREGAVIARTGDDEFGILLESTTVDRGFQIAETQRQALQAFKFSWEQQSVPVSVSIGIVAVDNSGDNAPGLLKAASSACNLAKQSGRNCCRVFQLSDEELQQQNRLIKSVPVIEQALEKNRINLHGQLITPLFMGEGSDHYEVLLRLIDDNNRPSSPVEFIHAAEKYDRMRSVDRWIIDTFFAWAKKYKGQISDIEGFSLNLSGQSVMDATFRAYIIQHLRNGALPPAKIGFEITETAVVKNMDQVNHFISEIKQFGCKFYLDDFGSGYASYSYLKDLSVDCIKIDGVFIKDMLQEKSSHAMVKSITEIAHYTNKQVIAEYVETEALIIALREIGVDYAQGFGVGMPQPLSTILKNAVAYG